MDKRTRAMRAKGHLCTDVHMTLAVVPKVVSAKGWVGKMDEHEMWWNLRRILYRNTMSYAETEIIRNWLQGFPQVIRVLQSKTWDPESQSLVDSFEQWYNRWWESGVFKQP